MVFGQSVLPAGTRVFQKALDFENRFGKVRYREKIPVLTRTGNDMTGSGGIERS
jgi:hypothetical protein